MMPRQYENRHRTAFLCYKIGSSSENLMRYDRQIAPELLAILPGLPCNADGPIFTEKWQLRAFALTINLYEQGHFTWQEWVAALSNELSGTADVPRHDPTRYYLHWVAAMEHFVTAKGLVDSTSLRERTHAFTRAAESSRSSFERKAEQ